MVKIKQLHAHRLFRCAKKLQLPHTTPTRARATLYGAVLAITLTFLGVTAFAGGSLQAESSSAELASHRKCQTTSCKKIRHAAERQERSAQQTTKRAYTKRTTTTTTTTTAPKSSTDNGTTTAAVSPAASNGSGIPTTPSGWKTVFQDDFNGSSVDTSKWGIYEGRGNAGIGTRDPSTVTTSNGELQINADGTRSGGMGSKFSGTYGLYEVRARVDRNTSYNTAVLLWPEDENWPEGGEIDISEIFASDNAARMGSFAHWGEDNQQVYHFENADFTQWHTYGVDWQRDRLTYYLDGRVIWTVTKPEAIPHSPHFFAIQFDVSKYATSSSSATFHVDWARVLQR